MGEMGPIEMIRGALPATEGVGGKTWEQWAEGIVERLTTEGYFIVREDPENRIPDEMWCRHGKGHGCPECHPWAENERLRFIIEEHHRDFAAIDKVLVDCEAGRIYDATMWFRIRQIVRPVDGAEDG